MATNMTKHQHTIETILSHQYKKPPCLTTATEFAPSNIALCKYWGKRNTALNLPQNSSFSISLGAYGAKITLCKNSKSVHDIYLNDKLLLSGSPLAKRISNYLNNFKHANAFYFTVSITLNIPFAAGFASSACIFAALIKALNTFYGWKLSLQALSILARLGSGSASRSLFDGFVQWHQGTQTNGLDSYAEPFNATWPKLQLGLLILNQNTKKTDSRTGMLRTTQTSPFNDAWLKKANTDLPLIKKAIIEKNFTLLGQTAESNALAMHATMLASTPPLCYFTKETIEAMHKVWSLRQTGMPLYFTEDAGPNLKLLFEQQDIHDVQRHFPKLIIIDLFPTHTEKESNNAH